MIPVDCEESFVLNLYKGMDEVHVRGHYHGLKLTDQATGTGARLLHPPDGERQWDGKGTNSHSIMFNLKLKTYNVTIVTQNAKFACWQLHCITCGNTKPDCGSCHSVSFIDLQNPCTS